MLAIFFVKKSIIFTLLLLKEIVMIELNEQEKRLAAKIKRLKESSGSHSPSIFTIAQKLPELQIKVDACFLSNPYATELFLNYLKKDLIDSDKLRDVLEFYPSQNSVIADVIAQYLNIDAENIFIGNGAIEIIQAVLHNFVGKKLIVNIPTFSSYYEFVRADTQVLYFQLLKEKQYALDIERYIKFVKDSKADSIVIINPNNPDGGYINYENLRYILTELKHLSNIILDESFIHFAYENKQYDLVQTEQLFKEFPNLIIIKSMSKDFGIAGIRSGYGIMSKDKVASLLHNGYLWNSSGLSEYFFRLYVQKYFLQEYEKIRKKYISQTQVFYDNLSKIQAIKVYPSMSNFALVELLDKSTSADFVTKMLVKYGIYTRTCNDKIGLDGEFVRIASRTYEENEIISNAMKDLFL